MRVNRTFLISSVASIALHLLLYKCVNPLSGVSGISGNSNVVASTSTLTFTLTTVAKSAQPQINSSSEIDSANKTPASDTERPVQQTSAFPSNGDLDDSGSSISLFTKSDFIPREYLTFVPKPLTEIEIPYPTSATNSTRISQEMSLYIDENGVVQQVKVSGPPIPVDFENAAMNTFLTSRFKPGEIDGHVVRSLIRVEVIFESQDTAQTTEARRTSINLH